MAVTHPTRSDDEIGTGPLSRGGAVLWWAIVISALTALTGATPLLLVIPLALEPGNAPLIALTFVPLGPALAAAVFAWRRFAADRDLRPARHFWRGYRLNALDVLRWWIPLLAAYTVIGLSLAAREEVTLPAGYAGLLLAIAAGLTLWGMNAVAISAVMSLRTRDVARLAAYYLAARWRVTLGSVLILGACAVGIMVTSDWVIALLLGLLALAVTRNAEPVLTDAIERFSHHA